MGFYRYYRSGGTESILIRILIRIGCDSGILGLFTFFVTVSLLVNFYKSFKRAISLCDLIEWTEVYVKSTP